MTYRGSTLMICTWLVGHSVSCCLRIVSEDAELSKSVEALLNFKEKAMFALSLSHH